MSDFRIRTQQISGDVVSVTLRGFLGSTISPGLEETIQKYCEQGVYKFIVNLADLKYINSRSICGFLKARELVCEYAGDIVLSRGGIPPGMVPFQPSADVQKEFDIIFGLAEVIKIRPDKVSALKAVA